MERTTIIIGAGVNKEINPSIDLGVELIKNIADRVTGRTVGGDEGLGKAIEKNFPHLDFNRRSEFLMHLDSYRSSVESPSIDAFMNELETFPEFARDKEDFLTIGMLMILGHVVGWEGTTTVKSLEAEKEKKATWLSVLANYVNDNQLFREPNQEKELQIVTFNYDRILERFLLDTFGIEIQRFVRDHVHHVYGRFANLKGLERKFPTEEEIEFDTPNDDFAILSKCSNNIKLIRQSVNTTSIKRIIQNSNKLIIFGYGLDAINNKRIGLGDWGEPYDRNLRFNIYSGAIPNWDFKTRRRVAEMVRGIRIDADIQYKSSRDFLHYALSEPYISNDKDLEKAEEK